MNSVVHVTMVYGGQGI